MVGQGPWSKARAGGGDRPVDIGRLRLGHREVDLLGARVDHVDGGIGGRYDPLAPDEETVGVAQRYCGLIVTVGGSPPRRGPVAPTPSAGSRPDLTTA